MAFFGTTVSEKEAVQILKEGGTVTVTATEDAYGSTSGIKGLWLMTATDAQGNTYSVRIAQKSTIKKYKTPTGLFSFYDAAGFTEAKVPMKAGGSVTLSLPTEP